MKHRLNFLLLLPICLIIQGCVITTGSGGSDDLEEVLFDESAKELVVDPSNEYNFSLMGGNNKITLQGNIQELFITGSHNYVVIDEDTHLESIIITGLHNIVVQEDELDTLVEEIEIVGDNNFIEVSQYNALIDAGSDNQVLMTNPSNL
jgi:hypothetical protein